MLAEMKLLLEIHLVLLIGAECPVILLIHFLVSVSNMKI